MKAYLLFILVALQNVAPSVEGRIHTKAEYVNLGETVTLECQNSGASTSLWQRKDYLISSGLDINPKAYGYDRLMITGDPMKGEYNIKISNITEEDLGIYSCEIVINEVAKQTRVTLRLHSHINDTQVTDEYTAKAKVLSTTTINSITDKMSRTELQNTTNRSFNNTASETVITTDIQIQRLADIKPSTSIHNEAIDTNRHEQAAHPHKNKSDHNSPTSERSYLEVIADTIYINPCLHSKENGESDGTHKVSSPEYGEASQKDQNSSDLDSYTDEFGRKELTNSEASVNMSTSIIDALDSLPAFCAGDPSNERLCSHDEVYVYCKSNKENTLSMVNFAELSESGSTVGESDQRFVLQNDDGQINPYENLTRIDKNDVHDYNTCIVPPRY